ncbi:thioesterase domain-containing protein [Streptomyces sp. H27-H1]|uniref:thioesterase II family protein n=1 Tax=Streptomyces sp. H27-H1 TaxID=2996461 RepID=UPI00226F347B|nr:alpha/beta fold hydrolase [Streptomyces sp. H27-H1]MCY0927952.1 thioesterase domain-containing protein [Streptomyces sp. H27-H1]
MNTRASSVIRPRPVDDPVLRLFVLHHAGGSHLAYTSWVAHFPEDWDVCLVEAPGRGPLSAVPPRRSADDLAAYLLEDLAPWLDAPYAFFGHSMGALVGYELTLQAIERSFEPPVWLGVSACESPFETVAPAGPPLHTLPGGELRTALGAMGGMPAPILEDDDLWAVYEPRLRADFQLVESWRPRPAERSRITVPCSLFGGEDDHVVTAEQLTAWSAGTDLLQGEHLYPGAHFYWDEQISLVVAQIVEEIDTASPGLASW